MKYRDEMKSNTTTKTKHQNARNSAQEKAKKLIELKQQKRKGKKGDKSLKDTVQALHSEILNLEKRRETTEMPIAKERELMDRLAILRRSLDDQEEVLLTQEHLNAEVSELDKDIDAEFSKADEQHNSVIKFFITPFIANKYFLRINTNLSNKRLISFFWINCYNPLFVIITNFQINSPVICVFQSFSVKTLSRD